MDCLIDNDFMKRVLKCKIVTECMLLNSITPKVFTVASADILPHSLLHLTLKKVVLLAKSYLAVERTMFILYYFKCFSRIVRNLNTSMLNSFGLKLKKKKKKLFVSQSSTSLHFCCNNCFFLPLLRLLSF